MAYFGVIYFANMGGVVEIVFNIRVTVVTCGGNLKLTQT